MRAEDLINDTIPCLKLNDLGGKAMIWMQEFRLTHLPVVEEGEFIGILSEDTILDSNDIDMPISQYLLTTDNSYIKHYQHFYDAIALATALKLQIVPVVSEDNLYMGVITVEDLLQAFSNFDSIQSQGGVIVLSMRRVDYSLSEIGRLIESDNASVMGVEVWNHSDDGSEVLVFLKVNKSDLTHIVATLERFNYHIHALYQESRNRSNEKERLDILMKYLNI